MDSSHYEKNPNYFSTLLKNYGEQCEIDDNDLIDIKYRYHYKHEPINIDGKKLLFYVAYAVNHEVNNRTFKDKALELLLKSCNNVSKTIVNVFKR